MKILYVILILFITNINYAQLINKKPIERIKNTYVDDLKMITRDIINAVSSGNIDMIAKYLSNGIDTSYEATSDTTQIFTPFIDIDSVKTSIIGDKATIQCGVFDEFTHYHSNETIILSYSKNKWKIISSRLLIKIIVNKHRDFAQVIKKNYDNIKQTVIKSKDSGRILSTQSSFLFSNSALIQEDAIGTYLTTINKAVTQQYVNKAVFNSPYDGRVVWTNGHDFFSVITDNQWDRIIYASYNGGWIKSYGDNPGDQSLMFASSIGLDKFGNIFVLEGGHNTEVIRLKYDESSSKIISPQYIPTQNVIDAADISLDDNSTPDDISDDSFWIADRAGNSIQQYNWSGGFLNKFTRVINPSSGMETDFSGPSKILIYYHNGREIALIDNNQKRVIIINNIASFQGDAIIGSYVSYTFQDPVKLNSLGIFQGIENGLFVSDQTNGMFHIFDGIGVSGYLASVRYTADGQQQWVKPQGIFSTYMSNSNGDDYLDGFTLDTWDNYHGINTYLAGCDFINPYLVSQIWHGWLPMIGIFATIPTYSNATVDLYRQDGTFIEHYEGGYQFSWPAGVQGGYAIGPWDVTNGTNAIGIFYAKIGITPYWNLNYPINYQLPPLYKYVYFALPVIGSITGPTSGFNGAYLLWNCVPTTGSGNFTYSWYRQDFGNSTWYPIQSGSSSSCSQQITNKSFTIRCDVKDNYNGNVSTFTKYVSSITTSGTLVSNEIWSGNITLTGTVYVPSGLTLTIQPGTNININSNVNLTVSGTLTATGTPSSLINFNAVSGNWGTLTFSGSGANGSSLSYANLLFGTEIDITNTNNVSIQSCNITNSSMSGLSFSGGTGCSATNNKIENSNTAHGIVVQNGANVTCTGNILKKINLNHHGVGIYFGGGGTGIAAQNDIEGFSWGICAIWGSSPTSHNVYYPAKNNRITNCYAGLEVYYSSYPTFGIPTAGDTYGYNSIYSNSVNTAVGLSYSSNPSTLYGCYNWWGNYPPNTSLFSLGSGSTFNYSPYQQTDPWSGYPLPSTKQQTPIMSPGDKIESHIASTQNAVNPTSSPAGVQDVDDSLFTGIDLRSNNKLKEAKDYFISYIKNHPDKQAAYTYLYDCADSSTTPDIINFFSSLPSKASKEQKLLLSYLYLKEGNIDLAKKVNDEIIKKNPNSPLGIRAELNNFYIALYNENDVNTASTLLNEIENQSSLSTPVELTTAEDDYNVYGSMLASKNGSSLPKIEQMTAAIEKPTSYSLDQNYPNPFNPSTMITYQMPNDGFVTLKIYDMLGREVRTLVNGYKSQGRYSVTFDASNLASGIYFYQLKAGDYSSIKKMVLLK